MTTAGYPSRVGTSFLPGLSGVSAAGARLMARLLSVQVGAPALPEVGTQQSLGGVFQTL